MGTEYVLRFFLVGAAVHAQAHPRLFPASARRRAPNDFAVTTDVFTLPAPPIFAVSLQRVLVGPSGRPRPGVDVTFRPMFHAFVDHARAALSGRFVIRTDKTGFLSIDLYRLGMYEVTVEAKEEVVRRIAVPDRSAIAIGHLLFPVVVSVAYAPTPPFTVVHGQSIELQPTVRSTDYRDLGVAPEDVLYSVADPTIASVQILGDRIVVHGLKAGRQHSVLRASTAHCLSSRLGIDGVTYLSSLPDNDVSPETALLRRRLLAAIIRRAVLDFALYKDADKERIRCDTRWPWMLRVVVFDGTEIIDSEGGTRFCTSARCWVSRPGRFANRRCG